MTSLTPLADASPTVADLNIDESPLEALTQISTATLIEAAPKIAEHFTAKRNRHGCRGGKKKKME